MAYLFILAAIHFTSLTFALYIFHVVCHITQSWWGCVLCVCDRFLLWRRWGERGGNSSHPPPPPSSHHCPQLGNVQSRLVIYHLIQLSQPRASPPAPPYYSFHRQLLLFPLSRPPATTHHSKVEFELLQPYNPAQPSPGAPHTAEKFQVKVKVRSKLG